MFPILVNEPAEGDDPGDDWNDAEEQVHALARWHALDAARAGYQRNGRGAAIVLWPPENELRVSFLPEAACLPLGPDVMGRIACYDPRAQFVLVFLLAGGDVDAYTYTVPGDQTLPAKANDRFWEQEGARRNRRVTVH